MKVLDALLLDYYICPRTRQALRQSGEFLVIPDGTQRYPITNGIPRIFSKPDDLTQWNDENWGFKWEQSVSILEHQKKAFWDYMLVLKTPEFFKDKVVLEACCGAGVPAREIAGAGAKLVIGFDISRAVDVAQAHSGGYPALHSVQTDIYDMPFRADSVDVVVCTAALHHVPDPKSAFQRLLQPLKPGGTLIIWVYSFEGTGTARLLVDPVRKVARRLPKPLLKALMWSAALPLWFVSRLYKRLGWLPWSKRLPLYDYMLYLNAFPLGKLYEIVLDMWVSPMTHWIKREEVEDWFGGRIENVEIKPILNRNWGAYGTLK